MTIQNSITTLFRFSFHSDPLGIAAVQGDASSRQYFRVTSAEVGTLIACHDPTFNAKNQAGYAFLLLHGILSDHALPVPALIALDAEQGLLFLEDCGDLLLQNLFDSPDKATIPDYYREIIDLLIQFQSIQGNDKEVPFCLSFDREKLMFEFDFFIEHALRNYFAPLFDQKSLTSLRHEFEKIAEILVQPRHFVLNHRDFHSRNILIHHERPVIIDFQDARMGLPQYDAVSLIRDSYVTLDPLLTEELKAYHYNALRSHNLCTISFDEYLYYFDMMAFQRNIKAIGTFAYQTCVKKNSSFDHSITPTLAYIPEYINSLSELRGAGNILQPLFERVVS
ncbi:MAG: aminoglycoside phosphotransferase [Chlorobium sp.]|nr:MAG: aminoglycoside phosphotransferase [Chlorobium sp.]